MVRIEKAAEELFSICGYERTSLRQITQKAGVNLAAVNYHFGSKESLFRAVFVRRLKPINLARLAKLDAAQHTAGEGTVHLDLLLQIYLEPVFELSRDTTCGGNHFVRIISRSLVEPLPVLEQILAEEFHPVTARFTQALRRHVPRLSPEDFLWRISFIIGAMHHTLATLHCMHQLTKGICKNDDHSAALVRLIQCSKIMLTSPSYAADRPCPI